MEGTNYSQFYYNFEILAGLAEGKPHGATFNDGDFYKFLEGASATLAVTNDAACSAKLDEIIARHRAGAGRPTATLTPGCSCISGKRNQRRRRSAIRKIGRFIIWANC